MKSDEDTEWDRISKERLEYLEKKYSLKLRLGWSIVIILISAPILLKYNEIDTFYWFFSSVLQGFAAMLGLLAIFFVYRLQMLKEDFKTAARNAASRFGFLSEGLSERSIIGILHGKIIEIDKKIAEFNKASKNSDEKELDNLKSIRKELDTTESHLIHYMFEQDDMKRLLWVPFFEIIILLSLSSVGIIFTPALYTFILCGTLFVSLTLVIIAWALYDLVDIIMKIFFRGGKGLF